MGTCDLRGHGTFPPKLGGLSPSMQRFFRCRGSFDLLGGCAVAESAGADASATWATVEASGTHVRRKVCVCCILLQISGAVVFRFNRVFALLHHICIIYDS